MDGHMNGFAFHIGHGEDDFVLGSMLKASQAKKAKHGPGVKTFGSHKILKSGWHEQDALRRQVDGLQARDWRPMHELAPIIEDDTAAVESEEQVVPDISRSPIAGDKRTMHISSAPASPHSVRRCLPTRLPSPLSRSRPLE